VPNPETLISHESQDSRPLWELREISKAFPGVQALDKVSLSLRRGQIHALLGENGSGKTTLAKCLAGAHQPDSGEMLLQGEPVVLDHPLDAVAHGVATIYQELSLVPALTVAENIFLGRPLTKAKTGLIDWEQMRRMTRVTLQELAIQMDPNAVVQSLSGAEQQLIEIAKAISLESSLVIMDEPTAALGLAETRRLHELIRRLTKRGKAILYISHRLDEVFQIADVITVLKDGLRIDTSPLAELDMSDVVQMMVGIDIEQHYPKEHNARSEVCLQVRDLVTENGVNGVSFDVHAGEVFGLGGMVGAGRTEIARALYGVDQLEGGTMQLFGKPVRFSTPTEAVAAGVGLVPENRKADGLFYNFEGPPNITISRLRTLLRGPFLSLAAERQAGREYVDRLRITPTSLERTVEFLSGGNQQKVVIARWLFSRAKLLILDEPTQGVDIGAKLEVYQVINELTEQGISIILISSDYPELLAISDRIAVIRDGRILHVAPANELNEYKLLSIASGADASNGNGTLRM